MLTCVPIGPDVGDIVNTEARIVNVVDETVPAIVVTRIAFPPQQEAVAGTLILVVQLPEASIRTAAVFQGAPSNFMPPTGIVSSGIKL
jgi:hypothetical protein